MKAVHLRIGRIVVEGLPEAEQRRFAGALEAELRKWAESGAAEGMTGSRRATVSTLDAGQLKAGASAREAAGQVVQSIARQVSARAGAHSHLPLISEKNAEMNGARRGRAVSGTTGGGEARGHV